MKTKFAFVALLAALSLIAFAVISSNAGEFANEWNFTVINNVLDMDTVDVGSSALEALIVSTKGGSVYRLDSAGNQEWAYAASADVLKIRGADIDGDGIDDEAIAGENNQHTLLAFDHDGTSLWSFTPNICLDGDGITCWTNINFGDPIFDMATGDVDGDGDDDIAVATDYGALVINNLGTSARLLFHTIPDGTSGSNQDTVRSITLANLDADNAKEIVYAQNNGTIFAYKYNPSVPNLNYTLLWSIDIGAVGHTHILMHEDIDNDGKDEILAGSDNFVAYMIDDDGAILWGYFAGSEIIATAFADLDNDNIKDEVVIGTYAGKIYALNDLGQKDWEYTIGEPVYSIYYNTFFSTNTKYIIAGSRNSATYIFDTNGNFIENLNQSGDVYDITALDTDGTNGKDILVFGTWDKKVTGYKEYFSAPSDTCTAPGSGDWVIKCSDNCVWTSAQNIPANVYIAGAGHLKLAADFVFTGSNQQLSIGSGCTLEIASGGFK